MKEHNARFWFSEALCSQYFTYQSNNELHLVLFENTDSVRAKLNRATQRNLPGVLFSWDEISHIAHDLFAHKTGQRMPNHPP
jgi:spore germination protein YaaH